MPQLKPLIITSTLETNKIEPTSLRRCASIFVLVREGSVFMYAFGTQLLIFVFIDPAAPLLAAEHRSQLHPPTHPKRGHPVIPSALPSTHTHTPYHPPRPAPLRPSPQRPQRVTDLNAHTPRDILTPLAPLPVTCTGQDPLPPSGFPWGATGRRIMMEPHMAFHYRCFITVSS